MNKSINIFDSQEEVGDIAPLAERMRPKSLDDIVGQEHIVGPNGAILKIIKSGVLSSIILWGPPGTGKLR